MKTPVKLWPSNRARAQQTQTGAAACRLPAFLPVVGARGVALALAMAAMLPTDTAAQVTRPAVAAPPAAPKSIVSTPPLTVRIWRDKESLEVSLVGRNDDEVAVAGGVPNAPGNRIEYAKIQRAHFEIEYDRYKVAKAIRENDWSTAVTTLLPAVKPMLPYLAIPENNAAELAMDVGTYMMRAAARTARIAGDDHGKQALASNQYEAAYNILKDCARAQWSSVGQVGVLKGCRCLLAMNKVKTAQYHVNQMTEPMPGDAALGHYWLIRAELDWRAKKYHEAMDAVLKSVCFESKDVETFPDALLLSARCYEELLDPYRARDVYYEVARIFPRTDWSAVAIERLKPIMEKGLTREKEKSAIENVFFKTADDINKLADQLLKEGEKPVVAEVEEPDVTPSSKSDKPAAKKPGADEPEAEAAPAAAPAPAPPAAKPKVGTGAAK